MQTTLGNLHAPCTWPLYVTSPCDFCMWPMCSSTQFVELSQLNTSSQFLQKRNFFQLPKICIVSTWYITWLLPFTLSISLNQPSVFVTRLTILHLKRQVPVGNSCLVADKDISEIPQDYVLFTYHPIILSKNWEEILSFDYPRAKSVPWHQ